MKYKQSYKRGKRGRSVYKRKGDSDKKSSRIVESKKIQYKE